VTALPDGRYDVFVVDANETGEGAMVLDLTILAGEHKSAVVTVTATGLARADVDLIGLPGTLLVHDGHPSVVLES
jgi:hypothetical protein